MKFGPQKTKNLFLGMHVREIVAKAKDGLRNGRVRVIAYPKFQKIFTTTIQLFPKKIKILEVCPPKITCWELNFHCRYIHSPNIEIPLPSQANALKAGERKKVGLIVLIKDKK